MTATTAVFSKTRGRSPRLEPPPDGATVGTVSATTLSSDEKGAASASAPHKRISAVSRAGVALPDSDRSSIDLNDMQRVMMSDDEARRIETEEEVIWDDVDNDNQMAKTGRVPSLLTPEAAPSDDEMSLEADRRVMVVIIGAAFVLALLQIGCICYQS